MRPTLSALLLLGIALFGGAAQATTYTTEDFNYSAGTAITATGNWTAHSAGGTNAILVTASGLSYPGYASGGGNAAAMTTSGEDDHTNTAFAHTTGTIYLAFLANFSAAQANGDYFIHLYQSSSLFYGRVFAKLVSGSLNFGVTRGAGTANYSTTPFALDTTHLIVLKYDLIAGSLNDTADLFVDPVISPTEPSPLVSATDVASADGTSIIGVALRQGNASNAPTQWVDGIRVATTWAEAVGAVEINGACCFTGGACLVLNAGACGVQGGEYQGDNTTCDPNLCPVEEGACCFTDGSCTFGTPEECTAGSGAYQGANIVCSPNPCPAPTRTLCEVAEDDADGIALLVGQRVAIQGIALCDGLTWSPTIREFQITDGNCCIDVFGGPLEPAVAAGDLVQVTGVVSNYNGKTEVTSPDLFVTVISSGNPLPDPALVTTGELAANGEAYESCLFKIQCASIVGGDAWPVLDANANVTIDDGSGPVTMRIDKDTDIDGTPAPAGEFGVIGIGDQFDTTSPYTEGWQIKPRFLADLVECPPPPPTGACCFTDATCQVLTATDCATAAGIYLGDATPCEPNPCGTEAVPGAAPHGQAVLFENAPNPVGERTTVRFYLPAGGAAWVEIYNAGGAIVQTLRTEAAGPGERTAIWDRTDRGGHRVPAGVYHYVVRTGAQPLHGKMTVVR